MIAFIWVWALSISMGMNRPVTVRLEESSRNSLMSEVSKNLHISASEGKLRVTFFIHPVRKLLINIYCFIKSGYKYHFTNNAAQRGNYGFFTVLLPDFFD